MGPAYYKARIAATGHHIGRRVTIGNGRHGTIVAMGPWVQGVCVQVDGGHPTWSHYEDTIALDCATLAR